jgi:electron transfer flavoprotein beta subunit
MGADRAIRVDTDASLDGGQVAKCLAAVVRKESPELVMSGKLAVDDENSQISAMLAAMLGWPQASQASKVEFVDDSTVKVTCEVDAGLEEVRVVLPAVISADLRLNEPRYASLPGIMKAKKKPMDIVPIAECGELGSQRAKVTTYRSLPPKAAGKIVGSVDELLAELSDKKLI